jgi:hypothetical protein
VRFEPHESEFADCVTIDGFLLCVPRFKLERR